MLEGWRKESNHPLSPQVVEAAKACITGNLLSVARALEAMSEVRKYPNQYAALSIIYFACHDADSEVEAKYTEIVGSWTDGW